MKSEIKGYLDQLHRYLGPIRKINEQFDTATADRASFEQRIAEIGTPDYKNTKAVHELAALRLQLELCDKEVSRLGEELRAHLQAPSPISDGCQLAAKVLQPLLERRLETIAASMRQFMSDEHGAVELARRSDAYGSAAHRIRLIGGLHLHTLMAPDRVAAIEKVVAQIEPILREALKSTPDLLQFIAPPPSESVRDEDPDADDLEDEEVTTSEEEAAPAGS